MAKYKKKRARELKHDRFRDTTMLLADRLAERVAGKSRQILYTIVAVIVCLAAAYFLIRWRQRHTEEAEQAMGRAITIAAAQVSASATEGSRELTFATEQERAQHAIDEFQKVAAKYGEPYRSEARYFIATNLLVTDRPKGLSELRSLSQGMGDVAVFAKFALGQADEADGNFDEAATLYSDIARLDQVTITPATANLRLAAVYEKQGKKKEAADLLFKIADQARNAKDKDGKPIPESGASREAAQELQKIDPDRYAQLTPPPSSQSIPF